MLMLFIHAALAGPTRCAAVYEGPTDRCALPGSWIAEGAGPSESRAKKVASEELERLIEAAIEVRRAKVQGTMGEVGVAQLQAGCADVAVQAQVHCYDEPALGTRSYCFADLRDQECWSGTPLQLEGIPWRLHQEGHQQLCEAVDLSLVERDASPALRARCHLECLLKAKVRCFE